jgi:carboxyl-terminal processing protease
VTVPRAIAFLALSALGACQALPADRLDEPGTRRRTSELIVRTLDRQGHYFADEAARDGFEQRLLRIAAQAMDAGEFYEATARALASLGEGHTALVASSRVPFGDTAPPLLLFEESGQVLVAGVAPGIEGGGTRSGDLVLSIDGNPAGDVLQQRLAGASASTEQGRRARALGQLLAGPTNTPARVSVRGTDGRLREVYPLRFLLEGEEAARFRFGFLDPRVRARALTARIGYIALPDFERDRELEAAHALASLGDPELVVLDLRGNPGGSIETMRAVAGLFVDRPLGFVELHENGAVETIPVRPAKVSSRAKLRMLVDARTGSAAELLAAGMQDLGRAEVLGMPTAGSTRTRLTLLLPGDVRLHYAGAAEFRRIGGSRVEGVGVKPDVMAQSTREDLARGAHGDPARDSMIRLAAGLR